MHKVEYTVIIVLSKAITLTKIKLYVGVVMNNLNIEQQIEAKKEEIVKVNEQINTLQAQLDNFEYESSEAEFDDSLDTYYTSVTVAGIEFNPSTVLKMCDYVAYRCMKADFDANYDVELCSEWVNLDRELFDLRYLLEDLEGELDVLQDELESLEVN